MNNRIKRLAIIALFPALMGATAGIAIPFSFLPAITLQTLFVYIAGLILSPKDAGMSMIIYIVLGIIGVPVFSGYVGGAGIFATVSGGFIIGFVIVAIFISFMKNVIFINKPFWNYSLILFVATTLLYMIGASYIAVLLNTSLWLTLVAMTAYLPGDFLKIYTALYAYMRIRSHVTYEPS